MATVPLSGTNIRLMTGVPFSNDYKNTRWFDTQSAQLSYFQNKPYTYANSEHTFQRIEGRNFVRVKKSIDSLWGTNYMMFQNTDYNSKWFYAFVTKLEYVQKETTDVHFEIDVFQTWKFDMNFKPSFVAREHCKLFDTQNMPIVNTVDEGLNYGTEYETISVEKYTPYSDLLFLVIVSKSAMHGDGTTTINAITPNMNGIPQPLSYYIHPFKRSGSALTLQINGANKSLTSPMDTLKGLFSYDDSVNNIVSLYVTEYIGKAPISYNGTVLNLDGFTFNSASIAQDGHPTVDTVYLKNAYEYDSLTANLGNKYYGFTMSDESKLYMHPYTVTILDDFKGNRVEIKNEYIKSTDLVLKVRGSLGTSNKVSYSVDNYNVIEGIDDEDKNIMSLEQALINNSPNDISILNSYLSAYLQGNRNQIENQKQAIVFNGTIGALTGGMVGMAQSSYHRNLPESTGMAQGTNPISKGIYGFNGFGTSAAALQLASGVGNAVIQMQGLQAKQKDIANTPPQMVKMGGNTSFDYGNGYSGVYVIKKQITKEYRDKLEGFFKMFGYKVNEVKTPNFHTRKYWNYIQTVNCNILGNLNNEDLSELKMVFDNGITLWHTDDVGNYDLVNEVVSDGVSGGSSGGSTGGSTQNIMMLPYGDSKTYGAGDDGTGERGYPDILQSLRTQDTVLKRIARPGYTVAQMVDLIDADIQGYNNITHVLFNLGTNDVGPTQPQLDKTTWTNNVLSIIDKLQGKFHCKIYLARVWRQTHNGQLTTLNDVWIPEIVSKRSSVYLGIDERDFVPTNTSDGIHPNHNGYVIMANKWNEVI